MSAKSPLLKKILNILNILFTEHLYYFSSPFMQLLLPHFFLDPETPVPPLDPYASAHTYFHFFSYPAQARCIITSTSLLLIFMPSVPKKHLSAHIQHEINQFNKEIMHARKLGQLYIHGYQHGLAWEFWP